MEYTDNCPNCDHEVIVEELDDAYVIKNKKGDVIRHCPSPSCRMKLEVVNGVMSVVES